MHWSALSTRIWSLTLLASTALAAQDPGPTVGSGQTAPEPVVDAAAEEAARTESADYGLPNVDLLLRAGRTVPPGLTATRAREREDERAAALEALRDEMAPGAPARVSWYRAVGSVLESASSEEELWFAAAASVAELRLYELDAQVAGGLGEGSSPVVRYAAREALRKLYGVRPTPGLPFERPFEPSPATGYLLDLLFASDARELESRRALFTSDPELALQALSDADPAVRAIAAQSAGTAAVDGALEPAPVRDALLAQLVGEVAALPFHSQLSALLGLVGGLGPESDEIARLRGVLLGIADDAREPLLLPIARGLARLPWIPGGNSPISLRAGSEHVAALLDRVADAPRADPDVTVGVLAAFDDLLSVVESEVAVEGSAEDGAWVRGCAARSALRSLVASPRAPESLRRSVADTLGRVAVADDVPVLLAVLRDSSSGPGLRYALLGTLGALAESLNGKAGPVVATLFDHLDDPDADLRRRALGLLASPKLENAVRARGVERLVGRLEAETVRELRGSLLALIRRHGTRAELDPLLALASFDDLASGDPSRGAALADTLAQLAGEDAAAIVASARRLAEVEDPTTALARLTSCLELVARLEDADAAALREDDHDRIVNWARRIRSVSGPFVNAFSGAPEFVRRLVDVHLPGLAAGGVPSVAERQHTRALFLADLTTLGDEVSEAAAFESFSNALSSAEATEEVFLAARVRRDRARFALERGRTSRALDDLRLLAGDTEVARVLELSDFRQLADLLIAPTREAAATDVGEAERAAAAVLRVLVSRDEWLDEPGAVRVRDLENLVRHVLAGGNAEATRGALAIFEDLPSTEPAPDESETSAEAPLWAGLERESNWRTTLLRLRTELEAALPDDAPTPVSDSTEAEVSAGDANSTDAR